MSSESPESPADLTLLEQAALLGGADVWQTRAIPRLGIPAIWMSDGPHGVRKQRHDADHLGIGESEQATCFPPSATVANAWDEQLAAEIGSALGREASALGVRMLLGPGLNIKRNPLGGRNFEYFSEDPELSGRLAAAYVRGIQSEGVAATPKHFAVNSQELRRMVSDSVVDERTLREIYLTGFEIVVREARPWAIMSSYNLVNGTYAHENRMLLTDVLRGEWGFDGAVVSDWGGSNEAVAAAAAGGTLEMPSPGFGSARELVTAVQSGALAASDLRDRAAEVQTLARRVTQRAAPAIVDADAHHALARRAAGEGAVLLRNEGDVLPLRPGTRVGLVGAFAAEPRYQGAGSSIVNPHRLTTLRGAIAETDLVLAGYAAGFGRDGARDDALLAGAAEIARRSDVVVLALAVPDADETEGRDRPHLRLPAAQLEALRRVADTGTPVIVVLSAGGPVETPWLERTAALVHGYLGGQAGAEALWDVLTGRVAPGGRLAETMPFALADDPTSARFPSDARTAEYREGLFVRYRYHSSAEVPPAFPFGFGLSYTRFAYDDLRVDGAAASFTVANVGESAGSDVAQLYVRRVSASGVYRPRIELKGFAKVRLAPGERTTVTVPFGERTFRFFDVRSSRWEIEAGEYEILVGPNSADLPLSARLRLDGTVPAVDADAAPARYASGDVRAVPDEDFAALLGRPIPDAAWTAPPFEENTPVERLRRSPSPLVRWAVRRLERAMRRDHAKPVPVIETVFVYYAPLRILHKLTAGRLSRGMTAAALRIADGAVLRGLAAAGRAFARERRADRRARAAFERAAGYSPTAGGVAARRRIRRAPRT